MTEQNDWVLRWFVKCQRRPGGLVVIGGGLDPAQAKVLQKVFADTSMRNERFVSKTESEKSFDELASKIAKRHALTNLKVMMYANIVLHSYVFP